MGLSGCQGPSQSSKPRGPLDFGSSFPGAEITDLGSRSGPTGAKAGHLFPVVFGKEGIVSIPKIDELRPRILTQDSKPCACGLTSKNKNKEACVCGPTSKPRSKGPLGPAAASHDELRLSAGRGAENHGSKRRVRFSTCWTRSALPKPAENPLRFVGNGKYKL